jgi:hypothetical protein
MSASASITQSLLVCTKPQIMLLHKLWEALTSEVISRVPVRNSEEHGPSRSSRLSQWPEVSITDSNICTLCSRHACSRFVGGTSAGLPHADASSPSVPGP